MEFFVGTSGWAYGWNPDRSLDWYLENSGLNAVELNASFYRFPFPNQIKSWAKKGGRLRWSIKVSRLITHVFKFDERAMEAWERFENLFHPMQGMIDFYLFQLPPSLTPKAMEVLESFICSTKLGNRFALEVRNQNWFSRECIEWARDLGITWVSVDCPDLPLDIFNTSNMVYERMHGRSSWYAHRYTEEELTDVAQRILNANPDKIYVFMNNQGSMLLNAQQMQRILMKFLE